MDYNLGRKGWFPEAGTFANSIGHVSNYPMAYVYAVFMALSGHLIGRRAHIRYATPLYPNSYVCLVGPSGLAHKSTAMNLGFESLGELQRQFATTRSLTTRQGLLVAMQGGGGMLMVWLDELASLLSRKRQDFAADLISGMVELYSCPPTAGNLTRIEPIEVEQPFVSLIAGSTVEWLHASLNANDLMAGFGNRMTFVLGDPRKDNPWPKAPYWEDLRWDKMLDYAGEAKLDENGLDVWKDYYDRFQTGQKKATPFIRVLSERIPEKILKAALVIAAWRNTHVINEETMTCAVDWGTYLNDCVVKLAPSFEHAEKQVMAAVHDGADTKQRLFGTLSHVFPTKRIREAVDNLRWLGLLVEEEGRYRALDKASTK